MPFPTRVAGADACGFHPSERSKKPTDPEDSVRDGYDYCCFGGSGCCPESAVAIEAALAHNAEVVSDRAHHLVDLDDDALMWLGRS